MTGDYRLRPSRIKESPLDESAAITLLGLEEENPRAADEWMARLYDAGWTLRAIGTPLGLTRQRVSQRVHRARQVETYVGGLPDVPPVPQRPVKPPPEPRWEDANPEEAARLREEYAVARTVNGGTKPDDPRRQVTEEFSAHLARLWDSGVSGYALARTLGCQWSAVRGRLARHGYRDPSPSQAHVRYGPSAGG